MVLIVLHEREREQKSPSNIPDEQLSYDAPDLYYAEGESRSQNRGEHEDQGTVPKRPLDPPPETTSDDDRVNEGTYDAVQSERPKGVCQRPSIALTYVDVDPHQLRREI